MSILQLRMKKIINEAPLHTMILPAVVIVILVSYFPLYGIIIGFKDYDIFKGIWASSWAGKAGFEHFLDFFSAPSFGTLIRNTVLIAFLKLGLLSFPPMILAICLNEVRNHRFKRITQTVSYLPHFISWVVVGGIMYNIFNPTNGPVNQLLISLNLMDQSVDFISSEKYFWPILILSQLWKDMGYNSILYLAVIASIDLQLYEAIDIDGGGRWAKVMHVTWPSVKGTFMILFILGCGQIMSGADATFEQCYVLGNAANRNVSDVLDTFILRTGLENARYSFATAAGLFKSVINLALLIMANKLSKSMTEKSLF